MMDKIDGAIVKIWYEDDKVKCCSGVCTPESCSRFEKCETVILLKRDYSCTAKS